MESVHEEWRPVAGYEGLYEVSSHGRVRSLDRVVPACVGDRRQTAGSRVHRGKMLKQFVAAKRYALVSLCAGGKPLRTYVHKLVATAFLGPVPDGKEINHRDGNKRNNAVANLEYVTKSENAAHAVQHGLVAVGDRCSHSKFTESQVREVMRRVRAGALHREAGAEFGMSAGRVSKIMRGRAWRHLQSA